MAGHAVLRRAVAGEVLHDHGHIAGLHAVGAVLEAGHQGGGDVSHELRILSVRGVVAGPAGVGDQVDLGAVHLVDALGVPDGSLGFRPRLKGVGISVAGNRRGETDLIGVAAEHRVGDQHIGDGDLAIDSTHILGQHVQGVVEQGAGLRIGILPDDTGADVVVQDFLGIVGFAVLGETDQLVQNHVPVFIVHLLGGSGGRVAGQLIFQQADALLLGHLAQQVGGPLLGGQAPVLKGVQLLVVVTVAEVLAALRDHAVVGDADGEAVLVVVEHRSHIFGGRLAGVGGIGGGDVAVLHRGLPRGGGGRCVLRLGTGGQQGDKHGCREQQGDNALLLHRDSPSFLP